MTETNTSSDSRPSAYSLPRTIRWESNQLFLLDQTQLPVTVVEEEQHSMEQVWDSIKKLKVRGAPAIGIAGAYGLLLGMRDLQKLSSEEFLEKIRSAAEYLDSSRPTAVNLKWALSRLVKCAEGISEQSSSDIYARLEQEAIEIHDEDRRLCRGIGEHGKPLIQDGMGVLTHCNAGALATSELGTALAPMYLAHDDGVQFKVYADETRPLLQGARLTAWELHHSGLDVTLLSDNMAAHIMSQGLIDLIITGADRVAANGDSANKIGTQGLAILAKHFSIPFYIACPYSTIDTHTPSGAEIVIEEREAEEVTYWGKHRTAPEGIKVRNPAFDVTPHSLIHGIITEQKIFRSPYSFSDSQT